MSKTSTVNLTLTVLGDGVNESDFFTIYSNATSPGTRTSLALTTGDNTIRATQVASFPVLGILQPPPGSTVTKLLKGVGGDAGIAIDPASPIVIGFSVAASSYVLNLSGPETVSIWYL
jgi:hypothetical protein